MKKKTKPSKESKVGMVAALDRKLEKARAKLSKRLEKVKKSQDKIRALRICRARIIAA